MAEDERRGTRGVGALLIIAFLIHIFDSFIRGSGEPFSTGPWMIMGLLYFLLAVWGMQLFQTKKGPIIASLIAWLVMPFMGMIVKFSSPLVGLIMFLTPVWVWYLIMRGDAGALGTIYMIGWTVLLGFAFFPTVQDYAGNAGFALPAYSPGITIGYFVHTVKVAVGNFWQALTQTQEKFTEAVKREIAIAGGDYYTGKVDEGAQMRLGVFLENLRAAESRFYDDGPVTLYATLKAETIGRPIDINVKCLADSKSVEPIPQDRFKVDTYEETDIDCIFPPGMLTSGFYTGKIAVDFDFSTRAYNKVYFMDKERLRDYKRRQVDPLEGIQDKAPTTIHTSGPVMIGMGFGSQPVGITPGAPGPTIGASITNGWTGKITKIDDIKFYVPTGLTVNQINGRDPVKIDCNAIADTEEKSVCDANLVNIYRLPTEIMDTLKNVTVQSFRATTQIDDASQLIGDAPIGFNNFKVSVDYKYAYETSLGFRVEERK